jgi:A/G-specific adenine glycosylase
MTALSACDLRHNRVQIVAFGLPRSHLVRDLRENVCRGTEFSGGSVGVDEVLGVVSQRQSHPMNRNGSEAQDLTSEETRRWLRRRVLAWFRERGRDFPWRQTNDPYCVLIAELLLQRTRADLVEPLYHRFISTYPTAEALSTADPIHTEDLLRPLGFLHRSRRLPALGKALVQRHHGRVPRSKAALLTLPGVGDYVANAVLTVAFRQRTPLVEPNIIRLLSRVFGRRSARARPRDDTELWGFVHELLPRRHAREFSLGLVDLGALVCRRRPRCFECPLRRRCVAFLSGEVTPVPTEKESARRAAR